MRNVVLARALSEANGKAARVFAVYVDEPAAFPTALKARDGKLGHTTRSSREDILLLPYRELIAIAQTVAPDPLWEQLSAWLEAKIRRALALRTKS